MPFSGAGVYSPPAADFPAVTQTVISSTKYNNVINDIATGLSLCLTKDGQQTATANIPFGGFRATNVGITAIAGSAATPAINVSDAATGLYRSAASELAITVAGTQRGRWDSTGLIVTGTVNVSTSVVTPLVGTDTAVQFGIKVNGTTRWAVDTGAGFAILPIGDNTQNLGSIANRIANVFTPIIDSGTTGSLSLKTNNGTEQARIPHIASAVNVLTLQGAPTTGLPNIGLAGSDTDIGMQLATKGNGNFDFYSDAGGAQQFRIVRTAGATRFLTVTGSTTNPTLSATAGNIAFGVGAAMGTGTGGATIGGVANVNSTAVGNIGVGTDDLMTYTLPANSLSAVGKGIRVRGWGTAANNANAKTVAFAFGSNTFGAALTISQAGGWTFDVIILKTGASTQDMGASLLESTNNTSTLVAGKQARWTLTATETDTANIIIKFTGVGVADNDVVQEGMVVEFFN